MPLIHIHGSQLFSPLALSTHELEVRNTGIAYKAHHQSGQKTSTRPPVRNEYSLISDEWVSKSTCLMGQVEFATKTSCFLLSSEFPKHLWTL